MPGLTRRLTRSVCAATRTGVACTVRPSTLPTDSVDRAASRFLCPCNAGSRPRVPSRSFLLPNARDTSDHRHVVQPAAKCDGDPRTSFQFFVSRSDRSGRSNRGKRLGLAPLALYSPVIRLQSRRAMPPMRPCQPLAPCLPATGKTGGGEPTILRGACTKVCFDSQASKSSERTFVRLTVRFCRMCRVVSTKLSRPFSSVASVDKYRGFGGSG